MGGAANSECLFSVISTTSEKAPELFRKSWGIFGKKMPNFFQKSIGVFPQASSCFLLKPIRLINYKTKKILYVLQHKTKNIAYLCSGLG